MRLLIIGDGKMGGAIEALAADAGFDVRAVLGQSANEGGLGIKVHAGGVDVAIEFTTPAAAPFNLRSCLEAGIPVVCGTTGWYEHRDRIEALARSQSGALLIASNFSLGAALMVELARTAGRLFANHPQFAPALVETHHSAKQDAPSGTAISIQAAAGASLGREIPTASVRVGSVPGTHTLLFDGPFEQIVLTHEARDRRVFADGALRAARWLTGRRGVFTMRDVLGGELA